uniref:SMB domain-containing protein n=1 Tax=Romanomermis culicivorax TaxID=13658 RepID=A0A915L4X1_ROMCU
MLQFLIVLLWLRFEIMHTGCLEADICCAGRNLSCKAVETGKPTYAQLESLINQRKEARKLAPRPSRPSKFLDNFLQKDTPKISNRSTIHENDEHGFSPVAFINEEPLVTRKPKANFYRSIHDSKGKRKYRDVPLPHSGNDEQQLLLLDNGAWKREISYEILNGDKVSDVVEIIDKNSWNVRNKVCYCDEMCREFLDCCSDYRYVCPKVDCQVGKWAKWSPCVSGRRRYYGIMKRSRNITIQPQHGGKKCPPLVEKRACAIKRDEVAQLLPYYLSRARTYSKGYKLNYELADLSEQNDPNNYCVIFESTWHNVKCNNETFTRSFAKKTRICVECQETARRPHNGRCWGQGKNGTLSFWSILRSKTCFGQWVRLARKQFCHCPSAFPAMERYIFV